MEGESRGEKARKRERRDGKRKRWGGEYFILALFKESSGSVQE